MTTNQPTDATEYAEISETELNALLSKKMAEFEAMEKHIESLTAQLAAKQAEAKAWESWGEQQHHALYALNEGVECYCVDTSKICRGCEDTINALSTPKPQPVDASSLARIARVALDADKKTRKFREWAEINFRHTLCPDFEEWFSDKYFDTDEDQALDKSCQTLTPNDISLAQALAGGA